MKGENCGTGDWATGGIRDAKINGDIWPMEVGNKVTYSQRFYNATGFESSTPQQRKCKVESTVSIEVNGNPTDTYKLACTQNYGDKLDRVYWFSPAMGLVKHRKGSANKPEQLLVSQP